MLDIQANQPCVTSGLDVIEMIDAVAAAHPGLAALEYEGVRIAYSALVAQSVDLARSLESEIPRGAFVAIEAQRTPAAVIAMVAAMRAKRGFVMLDLNDGEAANRQKLLRLCVNKVVMTGSDAGELLLSHISDVLPVARARSLRPDLEELGTSAAYALYTSGSTGEPKCVLVGHEGLAPVIRDHVDRLDVNATTRTLQFARLTFDGSLTEIFWTLCGGGCLVLVNEEALLPGSVLQTTLERHRITHLKTTPFALTATEPSVAMTLAHVVNGGGACRKRNVSKWGAQATFHNAYGCTETTICNLLTDGLTAGDCVDGIPLGKPVGRCAVELHEAQNQRGELVVSGPSVAIGYLHDSGIEKFESADGSATYLTGDRVEQRGDSFFYIERNDRQLKVRGYRIDPGEVEDLVCRYDGIAEAVVVAESHSASAKISTEDALVCYFVGEAETRALREQLGKSLPQYKVPSVFKQLSEMPYTRNGKVDREALRDLRRVPNASDGDPAKDADRIIDLVRQLTGTDDASSADNFFDIGGDSASSLILLQTLKEMGWATAGVRDVLRAPTIGKLIEDLEKAKETASCVA